MSSADQSRGRVKVRLEPEKREDSRQLWRRAQWEDRGSKNRDKERSQWVWVCVLVERRRSSRNTFLQK